MLKKSALNRVFQQYLAGPLTDSLSELNFKYVKSKSSFILSGRECELRLWAVFNSSPLSRSEKGSLIFSYTLSPFIEFPKFSKWYKTTFKKKLLYKKQLPDYKIVSWFEIHASDFESSDFYEPTPAILFKSNITTMLAQRDGLERNIEVAEGSEERLQSLLMLFDASDNFDILCHGDFVPPEIQCDLLAYSGNLMLAEARYEAVYTELFNYLESKLDPRYANALKNNCQKKIADLSQNFQTLYQKQINGKRQFVTASVSAGEGHQILIGSCHYRQITKIEDISLQIHFWHGLNSDSKAGICVHDEFVVTPHHNNLKSKWDFRGVKLDEWKENNDLQDSISLASDINVVLPKDTYESAISITKDRKYVFAGGFHSKGMFYNLSTCESVPLYAHETNTPGYKASYNVSHNFGVYQAKFVLNDSLLIAGGTHAKHVAWKMPNLERIEMTPSHEFTFAGAPPRTEFANDIKQITSLDSCDAFVTIIRGHALIWDKYCNQTRTIADIQMLKCTPDERYLVIVDSEENVSIYEKQNC